MYLRVGNSQYHVSNKLKVFATDKWLYTLVSMFSYNVH